MATLQEQYDEAMFDFSTDNYDSAIARLKTLLAEDPAYFDAQLSLGMAYYRKGDYTSAIAEGHKAEKLQPRDQLVHTNLSLFYMKAGDKKTAEHHGLQARIASWRENLATPGTVPPGDSELQLAKPKPPPVKPPEKYPDMPWKKKPKLAANPESTAGGEVSREGETPAPLSPPSGGFISVADLASLPPGHGRTIHVRGREFALFNLDGEFFAIDNTCSHKGGPLGAGMLKDGRVFCPLHGWEFDVKTGACVTRDDRPVNCYPTRVRGGQVEICV